MWRPTSTILRLVEDGPEELPLAAHVVLRVRTSSDRSRPQEASMTDTTVMKVSSAHSPKGDQGQKYLASGKSLSMRLWQDEPPADAKPPSRRDYETVGYVISGSAELHIEGQMIKLEPGDSWAVPKGAEHTYKILENFTAVEATSPPAEVHGRD